MLKKLCSMLLVLAVLCSCIATAFVIEASAAIDTDEFMIADWVFGDTVYYRGADSLMAEYADLGITDIFLLSKGTLGKLAWQSSVDGATMSYSSKDLLEETCTAAAKYGIRVHAWMAVGQDSNYIASNTDAIAYHFRHGTGSSVTQYVDLRNSGYRSYMRALIKELDSYGIAGVHFDYVRYANLFYDWGSSARNVLVNDYGITTAEYNAATMAMAVTANNDYGASYQVTTNSDGYYVYTASGGTTPSGVGFANALAGNGSTNALNGATKIAKMRKDNLKSFISEVTQDLSDDKLVSCAIMPESVNDPFAQASYCQDPEVLKDVVDFVAIMSYTQEYAAANTWPGTLAEACAKDGCNAIAAIQTFDSTATSINPTCADIYEQYADIISTRNTVNASSSTGKVLGIAFFRAAKTTLASAFVKDSTTMNFKVHAQDESTTALTKLTFTMKNGVKISEITNKTGWGSATFSISSDKTTLTISNTSGMLSSYGSASFDMTYTGTVSETTGACAMTAYNSSGEDYAFCSTIFSNHQHSYTESITTDATCEKVGVKTYTCSCGDSYTESIAALGHCYSDPVVTTEPTCISAGIATYTCMVCSATYSEDIEKGAHSYVSSYNAEEDVTTYTCSVCGSSYDSGCGLVHKRVETWETGEKTHFAFCYSCSLGQEYNCCFEVSERVNATCTTDGYIVYVCSAHRDTSTSELITDAFSGAGCTNTYTETLPAGCTYNYVSNLDGTHSKICTVCNTIAETVDCTIVSGVCSVCGFTENEFTLLHFKENSPETTWNWQLSNTDSSVLFDSTSNGAMNATTPDTVTNPYFYVAAQDECAIHHVVAEGDVIEVRLRMNVTSNPDYISGVTPDFRLQSGTGNYGNVSGNGYMGLSTLTDDWQTVQIPIVCEEYPEGYVINRVLFDPWSTDVEVTLGATFDIDYIYIGQKDSAPSATPEYLYFDFTNSDEAIRRYNNNVYEGNNFDLIPWAYNTNRTAKPAFDYTAEGTLNISGITGSYAYAQTTTLDGGLDQTPINYLVASGDVAEVRFKTSNLIAASGATPSMKLYFLLEESASTMQGVNLVGVDSQLFISGEYVTVRASLASAKGKLISAVRPQIDNVNDDGTGKLTIDYIYIGPSNNKPSNNSGSLYFDFENTEEDRIRYDSTIYGTYNYDNSGWGINSARNELPTFNNQLGTMTTVVTGSNPYLQIYADGPSLLNRPLNFNPNEVEMVQVRFKVSGMEAYNADGEANPNFAIKFIFDDETQAITADYLTYALTAAELDSDEYITVTLPVNDFMQGYAKITSVQVVINDARAMSDKTATVTYDYIYVGPKKDGINFIYFYNEDGSECLSKTIAQPNVALTYTGETPAKNFTDSVHYEFVGWVDQDGNAVNISSTTFADDMNLYASFKTTAHAMAYVSDKNGHNSQCSCGYATAVVSHTWDNGTVTSEGNCVTNGELTYQCTACSYTKVEVTEMSGHNYVAVVTAASCTSDGYTTHTCSYCSDSYQTDYVTAIGHDYTVVTTAPTCSAAGSIVSTCKACGDVIKQTQAALGHSAVYCPQIDPTCSSVGYEAHYECESCGKFFIDEECKYAVPTAYLAIDKIDHTYVEEITEATCTADGLKVVTCTGCGDCTSEVIPSTGHNIVYHAETVATCTQNGYSEHYKCEGCNTYYIDANGSYAVPEAYLKTGSATGHTYGIRNNGEDHSMICTNCDLDRHFAHSFSNGVCACGAKESVDSGYVLDKNLSFSMNITVGAEVSVTYSIVADNVSSFNDFYLVVTKNVADGEAVTTTYGITADRTAMTTRIHPTTGQTMMYQAVFKGITAKEMGDNFETVLYAVAADGTVYCSETTSTSIKDFLISKINSASSTDTYKTMAVDMLKYGAAAQVRLGYNTNNLVTADLTAAQLAYATQEIPVAVNNAASKGNGASVNTNITVTSRVRLNLSCIYTTATNPDNIKCVITDSEGTVLAEIATTNKGGIMFSAIYDDLGAKEMRDVINATFYEGETAISQTVSWSVESYVAQVRAKSNVATDELNMVNAMLAYGDAVAAYMETK